MRPLSLSVSRLVFLLGWVVLPGCVHGVVPGTGESPPPPVFIRNVTVMDVKNKRLLPGQDIDVYNGRISRIGTGLSPREGATEIDGGRLVALAGFVNTHTHLWQHLTRGFQPSGQLQAWKSIYQYAHYLSPEDVHQITLAAANQALLSGITTCIDFTSVNFREYNLEETMKAMIAARLDGAVVWWHPAAFLPPEVRKAELLRLKTLAPNRVDLWMGFGPLSFFSLPAVYDGIWTAKDNKLRMTEHTMENVQEQRDLYKSLTAYLTQYSSQLKQEDRQLLQELIEEGPPAQHDTFVRMQRLASRLLDDKLLNPPLKPEEESALKQLGSKPSISPVPLLKHLGALDGFLSIHSVWQDTEDLKSYRDKNVIISYNPESNMYLSSGVAPILDAIRPPPLSKVEDLTKPDCRESLPGSLSKPLVVTLGTDGASSNDGIDFFSAMRAAVNLQKVDTLDPTLSCAFGPWQVLEAATIGGAAALGQSARIGSLEQGYEADIVLLSKDRLGLAPLKGGEDQGTADQWASMIVNSAGPRDIAWVLSNGQIVVKEGRLQRYDEEKLAQKLTEITNAAVKRQADGEEWVEQISLRSPDVSPRWFRYRSVRKKDKLMVKVTNNSGKDLLLRVAFSGEIFGGTAAPVLNEEVLKERFPLDPPKKWWDKTPRLKNGEFAWLLKTKDEFRYTLEFPPGSCGEQICQYQREGGAEQLLLLAQPAPIK